MKRLALLAVALLVTPLQAATTTEDYILCEAPDWDRNTKYYSSVFQGPYGSLSGIKLNFHNYLEEQLGGDVDYNRMLCFYEDTRSEAEVERNRYAETARRSGFNVQLTDWTN